MTALAIILGVANVHAALIPYYQMDSLAILSDAIVFAEELDDGRQVMRTNEWGSVHSSREVRFRVLDAVKGTLTNGQEIVVVVSDVFTRRYAIDALSPTNQPSIPLGHALLFLERRFGALHPVLGGIKLVIGNQVYCYGQFISNPGPLWLALQRPENLNLPDVEPYTEVKLREDLILAMQKAKTLSKPKRVALDEVIRKMPLTQVPGDADRKFTEPQRRQTEAETKELKAMNNKTGWQQVWRLEQSSISDKYEAARALVSSNMTVRAVTNVLGQFSAAVRYHGLIIGKKTESFSRRGVSYKFPDGTIDILFIPNGEQFDDWKFDEIRLHTNREERATDPEPGVAGEMR